MIDFDHGGAILLDNLKWPMRDVLHQDAQATYVAKETELQTFFTSGSLKIIIKHK